MPGRQRSSAALSLPTRIRSYDWRGAAEALGVRGYAVLPGLLPADACAELAALYEDERRFRAHIVMARHAFGLGDYKYFRYPLPPLVAALRRALYPHLAPVARAWAPALGLDPEVPDALEDVLARCRAAGQARPTPLLLRYGRDGYNCLHQDLYGEVVFPLQATVLLSRPGHDFAGGEFLLVEQRPRAQPRGEVVPLRQGDAVVFATRHRPAAGRRGTYRVTLRHGVSRVTRGTRFALGLIFHDSR